MSSKNIEIIHQKMFVIKINGSFFFNIINKTVSTFLFATSYGIYQENLSKAHNKKQEEYNY